MYIPTDLKCINPNRNNNNNIIDYLRHHISSWCAYKKALRARTHARTHTRTHACTHAYTRAYTNARTHAHTHTRTCTVARTHPRAHARTHARTHALTHTHTHTHTRGKKCHLGLKHQCQKTNQNELMSSVNMGNINEDKKVTFYWLQPISTPEREQLCLREE